MKQSANAKSHVSGFFREAQETMKLKFRGWENDLPHQGEKGGIRERRVRDFLSKVLPTRYGIGSGHIIDTQGQVSFQSDIVIYDAQGGIALPVDDYYSLFPCECVYAVIEVKSKLNAYNGKKGLSGTIYECLEANTRLKSLDRKRYSLSPIHYIVFSYTTAWKSNQEDRVRYWFENLGAKFTRKLPEVIFILKPNFVLGTTGPTGYNETGKMTNIYQKNPLLYFISDLIHRLSQTKVETPNLWNDYNNWLPGDVIVQIYKHPKVV